MRLATWAENAAGCRLGMIAPKSRAHGIMGWVHVITQLQSHPISAQQAKPLVAPTASQPLLRLQLSVVIHAHQAPLYLARIASLRHPKVPQPITTARPVISYQARNAAQRSAPQSPITPAPAGARSTATTATHQKPITKALPRSIPVRPTGFSTAPAAAKP